MREPENVPREETSASPGAIKTMLIVEDEPEIRALLVAQLSNDFRCLEAPDGKAALSMAEQYSPDMILCDIDLPGINGYDVCISLKEKEQTAHIPIIFLTAYASDSARLQGLRVHGDDFITKPPSIEELRLRIANRLRTRDALLHRVQSKLISEELSLPDVATKDQEFVAKAIKFKRDIDASLEANYTSSGFGAAALAKMVHRSTRTLQRHMEQYGMGSTPLEYIREFRLRKAAELLRGNRRISEVATECGLDPKTFGEVFRKRYGKLPSDWRKANLSEGIH
jgi:DNA-binding response OmpR family regulator